MPRRAVVILPRPYWVIFVNVFIEVAVTNTNQIDYSILVIDLCQEVFAKLPLSSPRAYVLIGAFRKRKKNVFLTLHTKADETKASLI